MSNAAATSIEARVLTIDSWECFFCECAVQTYMTIHHPISLEPIIKGLALARRAQLEYEAVGQSMT